jgi:UDPglucose 6-dehydrogenase
MDTSNVPSIGVIGAGFVGGAMIRGFSGYTDIKVYDKYKKIGSMEEVCRQDILFVCVPTPMTTEGRCDTRIVESVLHSIEEAVRHRLDREETKPVVLRSTVPPDFCRKFYHDSGYLDLMFMPEFLTERTADLDFINAPRFLLGCCGLNENTEAIRRLFNHRFPGVPFRLMSWEGASLVKYGTNVFFTVKLSFFNELCDLADRYEENGQEIINEVLQDGRIGRSHFQVPGPDGDRGWGGHCFPKDINSYMHIARDKGLQPVMAEAAEEVNFRVRANRNWENMKGRAVSEDWKSGKQLLKEALEDD